ncbi:MAG TPA: response regulator transcription factor [Burkholderiaceae bacterium]|jgi:two-component system OmpR family response regulator|nr:response regulator transcription factor [Burkholderiaceae bacterium]
MRVLLVEDDQMIGNAMEYALRAANYAVDWVTDGQSALSTAQTQYYDAILLDLGLPKRDGLEVLRGIRSAGNATPVLIVSARDAVESRIAGLDLGADDYLLKPFDMAELLARMRAVIRRKNGHASSTLDNGAISLDLTTREITVDSKTIHLSAREFSLIEALLIRPGAILSRQELEDRIYGWHHEVESNAVEFLIHGLRKKLGTHAIKNVRGLGWMVSKPV